MSSCSLKYVVGRTNPNCYNMVQVFDKHNRGYISASDLRAVLQCLGEDLSEEESK
jgi:Ca2+-binding EF-hand superfamily protein